jgi:uncharacterized DUF497 family protein
MIEKHGVLVADAAKMFGLKVNTIYKTKRAEEVREKIGALGVPNGGFSMSILDNLHTISGNANVLRKAARVLHDYKVRGSEAEQVIGDVRGVDTEAQQIIQLEKWESVLSERAKPKKKVEKLPHREVNRARLFGLLQGLARFLETNKTASQAQVLDSAHVEIVRKCWGVIRPGIERILQEVW